MFRACFFSLGLFVGLWGGAFLMVDQVVLNAAVVEDPAPDGGLAGMLKTADVAAEPRQLLDPPEWAAYFLLSVGSVTMLYSAALPRRSPAKS